MSQQIELVLSPYMEIFDVVVPKDHKLRILKEHIDFSFVYSLVKDNYCLDNGRQAEDPVRMFKYLFLKCVYDLSDRGLIDRAMTDLAFKYFLDLTPESEVISSSLLSKFRRNRLKDKDLLDLLIAKSVKKGIELGVLKSRTLIIDATHTSSRFNPYTPVELLRIRSSRVRHAVYESVTTPDKLREMFPAEPTSDDIDLEMEYCTALIKCVRERTDTVGMPKVDEALNYLEETLDDIADHFTSSVTDDDARVGHKTADSEFFGYKTHIAMTKERVITAATVTSGDKGDTGELGELVAKSRENLGADDCDRKVDEVLGDGAYGSAANLKLAKEEKFRLVARPNPMLQKGNEFKDDGFELNKDAGMYTCPAGHLAVSKAVRKYKDRSKGNDRVVFRFDPAKCQCCKLRDKCLSPGARTRNYSIPIRTEEQEEQIEYCKTDEFREKIRDRYMIEAKNSELKHVFGYEKALSFGINSMKLQGAVAIYASNIIRILRLGGIMK